MERGLALSISLSFLGLLLLVDHPLHPFIIILQDGWTDGSRNQDWSILRGSNFDVHPNRHAVTPGFTVC